MTKKAPKPQAPKPRAQSGQHQLTLYYYNPRSMTRSEPLATVPNAKAARAYIRRSWSAQVGPLGQDRIQVVDAAGQVIMQFAIDGSPVEK